MTMRSPTRDTYGAAVREVAQNYRPVAKWLTRERIPAQRNGRRTAQSVKTSLSAMSD
jgi:hypothetical protein